MSESGRNRPAPGMVAVGAAFGCALVASLLVRDFTESTTLRIVTPVVAALLGILVTIAVLQARSRKP